MARSGRGYLLRGNSTRRRLRLEPLESRTLLSAGGWPGTVLHDSAANLFTVDLDDGMALKYVGNTGVVMSDVAFSPSDDLYAITLPEWGGPSELYSLDVDFESPSPTVVTEYIATISVGIGQGIYVNSLEFNDAGELFAAGWDQLGMAYLFEIDPDTAGAERVLDLNYNWSAGDLAFDGDGNLYLTTSDGYSGGLLRITPEQDSFEVVGEEMQYDLYGLTHGPTPAVYGFSSARQVYQINPANGEETLVAEFDEPQLSDINGVATVFSPPTDLGEVDFRHLPGEEPTLGELWYRVVAAREGLLTVALANVDPNAQIDLTLYQFDDQGRFVKLPTKELGELRLDYEHTVAGAEYFVEIEGAESSVDVRVANLFELTGNGAIVYGTQQDDTFEFAPGPPYTIMINGVNYPYNFNPGSLVPVTFDGDIGHDVALLTGSSGADVATLSLASSTGIASRSGYYEVTVSGTPEISFDGGGGNDSATLIGSGLADAIALEPKSASVEGLNGTLQVANVATIDVDAGAGTDSATFTGTLDNETVDLGYLEADFSGTGFSGSVSNVESITAVAGGGYDTASLSDSPGRDVLQAYPSWASLEGTGFSLHVSGFDEVSAHATPGGNDVAHLRGAAAGKNTFKATHEYGQLRGIGYSSRAESFRYVHAYGNPGSGDNDVAFLDGDPSGVDTFKAWPDQAKLYGSEYYVRVKSFRYVHASSNAGGSDVALLYDQPGSADTFKAWPDQAKLYGSEYYVAAKSFRNVHAFATPGYGDVALLYDQPGSADTFKASPDQAKLYGSEYYVGAKSFRYVHAFATPGYSDVAFLYDQPGSADTFAAWPDQAKLYGLGYYLAAKSFRNVHAHATPGDNDVARFYDDPYGFDTFEAWPDQAKLYGSGYYIRAKSFRYVYADASRSGSDDAILHDSALADYLEAADNWAELYDAAGSFFYRVSDFDTIKAISTTPTGDIKILAAVDYALDPDGHWQEP